jgi:hypothetical protein
MAPLVMETAEPQEALGHGYRLVWEAELSVDHDDPYFFDHPLDHVPAMLLVESALSLVAAAVAGTEGATPPRSFRRLRLGFHRFCEVDAASVVRVWPAGDESGHWQVEFVQFGRTIAEGTVECWNGDTEVAAETVAADTALAGQAAPPVDAELVHRSRPENVLIGGFEQLDTDQYVARLIPPPRGHYLRRRGERVRSLGELIEGIRQFGTLLGHQARDVAIGRQFIVTAIDITMHRSVSRDEQVALRTQDLPDVRGTGAGSMTFTLHSLSEPDASGAPVTGEVIGEARADGLVMAAQDYERLRAAVRADAAKGR